MVLVLAAAETWSPAFSTYAGGSGDDAARAVAVDAAGNVYVTGDTASADFPIRNAFQSTNTGLEAFVAKLDPTGGVLWATYVGGDGGDVGSGIAVDGAGNVVVCGGTTSTNFPTQNPIQPTVAGSYTGFVTKLAPSGASLVFSTYLGGTGGDYAYALALGPAGDVYVAGGTNSTDFPTASPLQAGNAGGADVFVARIDAAGTRLVYSTYLGGSGNDHAYGLAVDGAGSAFLAGQTYSVDFPLSGPLQATYGGGADAFVTRLDPSGSALVWSTFLGGRSDDHAEGLAIDGSGGSYVVGKTDSVDFPLASPFQSTPGGLDAFVTRIGPSGNALVWSTYLGGGGAEEGLGIAVDAAGTVAVTGSTVSADFPVTEVAPGAEASATDAYVALFDGAGALLRSSFLGGTDDDVGYGVTLDRWGRATVAGSTRSADFPLVDPAQPAGAGGLDGFASRLAVPCSGTLQLAPATLPGAAAGASYSATITVTGGTPPYVVARSSGALPPGLGLAQSGALSGTAAAAGRYAFEVTAYDAAGACGTRAYVLDVISPGRDDDVLCGMGLGMPNPNRVRALRPDGTPAAADFLAYGAGAWGANVAGAALPGGSRGAILTGPGPGPSLGPHVRGFRRDGSAIARVGFYAYGTLRYGANVTAGDLDRLLQDEIVTGAPPGPPFGPHVRAFRDDGARVTAMAAISFYAYTTLQWGANVAAGDVDADGFAEILTGPGPGRPFGPHVRGFDYDGVRLTDNPRIGYFAFPAPTDIGVNVAAGDVDGDGWQEIAGAMGPGAGPAYRARLRSFSYATGQITVLPGADVTLSVGTSYGARIGAGDVSSDGRAEELGGLGRDPAAPALLLPLAYAGGRLVPLASLDPFPSAAHGVNADTADLGF